jgi:hypothetical protein
MAVKKASSGKELRKALVIKELTLLLVQNHFALTIQGQRAKNKRQRANMG